MSKDNGAEKARLLGAVAFHIHRKMPPDEALTACIEAEGRGGKHRQWRQAAQVLQDEGFVPALVKAELVGEEAASVLEVVAGSGDHRLLAAALKALADRLEA